MAIKEETKRATIKIKDSIKDKYEKLSLDLYGAKLSISDKLETTLLKEIEEMEKALKKSKK